MEDIKFIPGSKVYKIRLDPKDILVVSIPSKLYNRVEVGRFSKRVEKYLRDWGISNPFLVLPDDMELFRLSIKEFNRMNEIEEEVEGFEDIDWNL